MSQKNDIKKRKQNDFGNKYQKHKLLMKSLKGGGDLEADYWQNESSMRLLNGDKIPKKQKKPTGAKRNKKRQDVIDKTKLNVEKNRVNRSRVTENDEEIPNKKLKKRRNFRLCKKLKYNYRVKHILPLSKRLVKRYKNCITVTGK